MKSLLQFTSLRACLLTCSLAAGALVIAPLSSSAAGGPNWTLLQQKAVAAIQQYDQAGVPTVTAPQASASSSITIGGSAVSIQEESFESTDGSGSYATTMSLLEGTQLLVNLVPTSGTQATSLELSPTTYQTEAVSHSEMSFAPANSKPGGVHPDTTTSFYIGSCEAWVISPATEPSIYGELIFAEAGFYTSCPTTSASVIAGMYYWNGSAGVGLNDTASDSGNPSVSPGVYAVDYYPCSAGGPVYFQNAGLYSALNEGSGGGSSVWSYLSCAA